MKLSYFPVTTVLPTSYISELMYILGIRPWVNPIPDSLLAIHPEELMSCLVNALSDRIGGSWKRKSDLLDMLCDIAWIIIESIISWNILTDIYAERYVLIDALMFFPESLNFRFHDS